MIKSALRVYRKNIWDVFAITGIMAIGLIIGCLLTLPVIINSINIAASKIISAASAIPEAGFDPSSFLTSFVNQFMGMNWGNPIGTIQNLLTRDDIYRIFMNALKDANFNKEVLEQMKAVTIQNSNLVISCIKNELITLIVSIVISGIIALIGSRLVIQMRNTKDKNVGKFIITFLLNLLTISIAYLLILLAILNLKGAGLILSIIAIFVFLPPFTLLWSSICYKTKDVKFTQLFNLKSILLLLLSSIIVIAISFAIVAIAYLISDAIALAIVIPFIITNNIIIENIVIDYVTNFNDKNNISGDYTSMKVYSDIDLKK